MRPVDVVATEQELGRQVLAIAGAYLWSTLFGLGMGVLIAAWLLGAA